MTARSPPLVTTNTDPGAIEKVVVRSFKTKVVELAVIVESVKTDIAGGDPP
jgi:hypothetical protein